MPIKSRVPILDRMFYDEAAREYCRSLPLEHFMESTPQSTQRAITLASLALVKAARPDVHVFNELLIQYPVGSDIRNLGRVVPDNMVVLHDGEIEARGSFNTPFEEAAPFLVMEYVSEENKRKDYHDNMVRYENDLRVPYYLMFEPDKQLLNLFRLTSRKKYVRVKPNSDDRLDIPALELEVRVVEGWVRFWFRGELLPLPAEMARNLGELRRRLQKVERQKEAAEAEVARLKAELDALRRGR